MQQLIKDLNNIERMSLKNSEKVLIKKWDLGSNQKKGCPYIKFEGDTPRVKKITRGDILVYADSCIIIATDEFSNNGKYKKIAHIDNLGDVPEGKQTVIFSIAQ